MNKKRWALLLLCIGLLTGYFKLFYKTWSNETVANNADCIVAVDVKRVINTLIWNFISTPSQWKAGSVFPSSGNAVSLDDMVKLPDYLFIFHTAGQPFNAWYTVLEINNKEDFAKGLQQFHFEKRGNHGYASTQLGIEFIQSGHQLLVGNLAVKDNQYIQQLAEELFTQRHYIKKEILKENTDAFSHLSVQLLKNDFLEEDHIIRLNFDKNSIRIDAALTQGAGATSKFRYNDSSLCTLAFTQPVTDLPLLFNDSVKAAISSAINFNIDSLLLKTNMDYQLDIEGIHPRIDSAISFTYDDNFNPVEKVVENKVEEPALNFVVNGIHVDAVYNYWNRSGKFEKTAAGNWFTPIPFVKSYCSVKDEKTLFITSGNYMAAPSKHSVECMLFFKLLLTKIPSSLLKYLPDGLSKAFKNIATVEALVSNEKGQIVLHISFNKKKNDLPIIEW